MGGRKQKFKSLKKSIYVIGEGITEQYYFSHLKVIKKYRCAVKPRFFKNTSIADIESQIEQLLKEDITIVCVFDADNSGRSKKEQERLNNLKAKYSENKNVVLCDSLPSIEYWFLLHYIDKCPHYQNAKAVENDLKKFIQDYKKTEVFLKKQKWVKDLTEVNGCLKSAIRRASKQKDTPSYSNIYKAIKLLQQKT